MAKRKVASTDNTVTVDNPDAGRLMVSDAPAPSLEGINTSDAARLRAGMAPDQWNAAIRFQCAVRDALERPVSLVEALNFGRVTFERFNDVAQPHPYIVVMRNEFDEARKLEAEAKAAADDAARKGAGL